MADNVLIDAGTGIPIATDDIAGVHFQRVKIVDGTLESSNPLVVDASGRITVLVASLPAGSNVIGKVDVNASLPAGANNIGDVDLASAIPAGTNNIGDVDLASSIPAGTNNIGDVDLASAIPAGSNLIGQVDLNSVPAAARTTDTNSAALATDKIMNNLTELTPKFAKISTSSTGATQVVAAVTSKKLRVLALAVVANAAVNVKFQSQVAPTDLTGLHYLAANGGFVLPFNPIGWFETIAGERLDINLSGAVAVGGSLSYIEV